MRNCFISCLLLVLLSSVVFGNEQKFVDDVEQFVAQLNSQEQAFEKRSIQTQMNIINERRVPYAMIYEQTGLFTWQLFSNCFFDSDVDTTTTVNVNIDYRPTTDQFTVIPAYFTFTSERPYDSLDDFKAFMITVFQSVGSAHSVLIDEANSRYGFTGHHYCQSFYSGTTKLVLDCYFVYVNDVACAFYYMTGDSFYDNALYQLFFELILDVVEFQQPSAINNESLKKPVNFDMSQNYPNPFNACTRIQYSVNEPTDVKIEIFDVNGRLVQTLVDKFHSQGQYDISFDANDLASGVYIYRISDMNHASRAHRMILVK